MRFMYGCSNFQTILEIIAGKKETGTARESATEAEEVLRLTEAEEVLRLAETEDHSHQEMHLMNTGTVEFFLHKQAKIIGSKSL
jgi:hypothetical protein